MTHSPSLPPYESFDGCRPLPCPLSCRADKVNGRAQRRAAHHRRRQDMYETATAKALRLRRAALVAALVAVGLVLPVFLAGLVAPPAYAASHTFTVTTTADIGDNNPDGVCDSCSLREAIQENNFN